MTTRRRTAGLALLTSGLLVLTGCQLASGDGTAHCLDFTCSTTLDLDAARLDDGRIGGTVRLTQHQAVGGFPDVIVLTNVLVGDVACYAQDGPRATVTFAVDPARSSIEHGPPVSAYSVSVHDGGTDPTADGFLFAPVVGDPSSCTAPAAGTTFIPVGSGSGFVVAASTAPSP